MTDTPEKKMKTKAERKQAAWAAFEKNAAVAVAAYQKIHDAAWDAYKKKVKEIDDE